jgi:5'-3' exonuclease
MGIPSYFSYIIKNYSNIIRSLKDVLNQDMHHLFMDCNSIVYDAFRGIEDSENMNVYQLEELLIEH